MRNRPESEVLLYDTTLRDGSQMQGIRFSVKDKVAISRMLDEFGFHYVEAGWPGANPTDDEFYLQLKQQPLKNAKLVSFGATCKPGVKAEQDLQLKKLLSAEAPVVTLVAKSSRFHIEEILQTSVEENCRMITDSVAYCLSQGREVWVDAEHFFDGYVADKDVSLRCLQAAVNAGAQGVVLCDTNGGTLPSDIEQVVQEVREKLNCPVGIHAHNDCELAVANALAAIDGGAVMVQGTVNGYGERCGNTNLISLIPTLQIKRHIPLVSDEQLTRLTELSRSVASRSNRNPDPFAPYVGNSAFAHKAGLHASAVKKHSHSYEHVNPESVGNKRHILVSNQAGRSNIQQKASSFDYVIDDLASALDRIKRKEMQGFQYEEGDASLELLLRKMSDDYCAPFKVKELAVHSHNRGQEIGLHHASVKVEVGDQQVWSAAEGSGPVEAIDRALKDALHHFWPQLKFSQLTDYKVRILNPEAATGATTHVWIEASYNSEVWNTIGCSPSIIEASQQALCDSLEFFILKNQKLLEQTEFNLNNSTINLKKCEGDHHGSNQSSRLDLV